MEQFFVTVVVALIIMLLAFLALAFACLVGKKRDHCSCSAAKRVMSQIEAREQAAKQAEKYDRKTLDPHNLPILPDGVKNKDKS